MSKFAMTTGLVLILIGLMGYYGQDPQAAEPQPSDPSAASDASPTNPASEGAEQAEKKGRSWTALIPAAFGIVIFICGLLANKDSLKKHAMHVAAGLSLIAVVAGLGRGVPALIKLINGAPDASGRTVVFLWLMVLVCVLFLVGAANSFIAARKQMAISENAKNSAEDGA